MLKLLLREFKSLLEAGQCTWHQQGRRASQWCSRQEVVLALLPLPFSKQLLLVLLEGALLIVVMKRVNRRRLCLEASRPTFRSNCFKISRVLVVSAPVSAWGASVIPKKMAMALLACQYGVQCAMKSMIGKMLAKRSLQPSSGYAWYLTTHLATSFSKDSESTFESYAISHLICIFSNWRIIILQRIFSILHPSRMFVSTDSSC